LKPTNRPPIDLLPPFDADKMTALQGLGRR
jgi:hypothetical protein